jgi:tetratricopeptide (TPR) repeat protein
MAKNSTIVLTHQGHLTNAAISAYVDGRLPEAQHNEFLKLLADDPFAQEAVEGLKLSNAQSILTKLEEIHVAVQEKTGAGKKKSFSLDVNWSLLAYAAAVIGLLVGVGFMLTWYKQNAQETQLAMVVPVDTISFQKEVTEIQETIPVVREDTVTAAAYIGLSESEAPASAPIASVAMPIEEAPPAPPIVTTRKETEKKDESVANRVVSGAAKMSANQTDDALRVTNDMSAKSFDKSQAIQATYQEGIQQFNTGNYKEAEQTFGEVIKSNPDNYDAVYFEGVSSYINGNNIKAEQNFDKLLKKGAYSEGSKWYKANILLKKGKTDEAKKILIELSGASGIFKERAVKKLETLD